MAKAGFFKKSSTKEEINDQTVSNETIRNIIKREDEKYEVKQIKDIFIMDRDITKYIIDNFPEICMDIRDSLWDLAETLENTIDYIEDKSSTVIKTERNFKLSESHRKKAIEVYDVVKKINDYIKWMDSEFSKKEEVVKSKNDSNIEEVKAEIGKEKEAEVKVEEVKIDKNNVEKVKQEEKADVKEEVVKDAGNSIAIFEDFTAKKPSAFKMENYFVKVTDWEDLAVKAAEILTKNYRNAKKRFENRNKKNNIKIVKKKSKENELRDSVIDILNIYEVPLDIFYVYVK
ncbi:MAG: viral A-type inclusion protein [Clostridium sp.]|nr:viral A-type inclusion protein [Clostridium sp.]